MSGISLDGFDALSGDLRREASQVGPRGAQVVADATNRAAARMAARVPRRTGALSAGFRGRTSRLGSTYRGEVYNTEPYDHFVDYGTSRMAAQPFSAPTVAELAPGFYADLESQAMPRL